MNGKLGKILLVDGYHGIYVPKTFAEIVDKRKIVNLDKNEERLNCLLEGPYSVGYWETWDELLGDCVLKSDEGREYCLEQNSGDLWLVPKNFYE